MNERKKKRIAILAVSLLGLISLISIAMFNNSAEVREPSIVVMRVDDIQDFAFASAQQFLLTESQSNHVPLSLAVIAGMFGDDQELVNSVKAVVSSGSDIAAHGWRHEDLGKLSLEEQVTLFQNAHSRIQTILDYDTQILIPPMYSSNEATIEAMTQTGYTVISTFIDLSEPGQVSGLISLPATIELSDYAGGIWTMKSAESVRSEVSISVQKYGFAVILTHPQEFITAGNLDSSKTSLYRSLLTTLESDYSFTTLTHLSQTLPGSYWQLTNSPIQPRLSS